MYYIRQKNDILVVAMQKISLATIFIRELNDFILISDFEYEPNRTLLSYEKISIRFCCFFSTATVSSTTFPSQLSQFTIPFRWLFIPIRLNILRAPILASKLSHGNSSFSLFISFPFSLSDAEQFFKRTIFKKTLTTMTTTMTMTTMTMMMTMTMKTGF